jgi:protein-L-isoaspartate(D-aspartate) O-methyltransferase
MAPSRSFDRPGGGDAPEALASRRAQMVREIEADGRETAHYTGRHAFSPRVMAAFAEVPRHEFVPAGDRDYAYFNEPLPIGHGQTISQPFIVALMTDLLDPEPGHVVLEVGTGSGYQAAILARLVRRVYSIEAVPALAASASERLARLGIDNVAVRAGDGAAGWPEHAPFDGILVTAAAPEIPPALVDQLKVGGRMVIPVDSGLWQDLRLVTRKQDGGIDSRTVLPVAFVPLTRPDT